MWVKKYRNKLSTTRLTVFIVLSSSHDAIVMRVREFRTHTHSLNPSLRKSNATLFVTHSLSMRTTSQLELVMNIENYLFCPLLYKCYEHDSSKKWRWSELHMKRGLKSQNIPALTPIGMRKSRKSTKLRTMRRQSPGTAYFVNWAVTEWNSWAAHTKIKDEKMTFNTG